MTTWHEQEGPDQKSSSLFDWAARLTDKKTTLGSAVRQFHFPLPTFHRWLAADGNGNHAAFEVIAQQKWRNRHPNYSRE